MKRTLLSALIGVGMVAAIFQILSGSEARTPEDYPLVCRGGGSLVIGIAPGERNIGFTFTRGTKPASEGLAPGECSWEDRGMYPNEPDRVSQHVEEGSNSLKVGGTLAPENRWYEELHSADKYWTFTVSNNGRGQLIAASARPNPGMDISPTARVPPGIRQILRPDLPRERAVDDETLKVIVLNGQADPSSRTEMLERLPVERNMIVLPAPQVLSREEKIGLLKSAGLKTLDETPTPYLTLTPQEPYAAGRGYLAFWDTARFEPNRNIASWNPAASPSGMMTVHLNFETKGIYLMTFAVSSSSEKTLAVEAPEFVVVADHGTRQTFLSKLQTKASVPEWQHLNIIVDVAKPGYYGFGLFLLGKPENLYHWTFSSCDVTAWRK